MWRFKAVQFLRYLNYVINILRGHPAHCKNTAQWNMAGRLYSKESWIWGQRGCWRSGSDCDINVCGAYNNACVLLTLVCLWPVLLVTSVHKNHCAWFAKANESSLNSSVWCSLPSLVLVLEQAADSKLQNYTGHPDTRMMKSNFQKQEEDAVSTSKTNQLQHGKDDSLSDVALEDAEFMR